MKGNPADHVDLPPRCAIAGTPAGNSPYTQEQLAEMHRRGLPLQTTPAVRILVEQRPWVASIRRRSEGEPIGKLSPVVQVPCPVLYLGRAKIQFIAPDGSIQVMPR